MKTITTTTMTRPAVLAAAGLLLLGTSFLHSLFGLYPSTYWAGTVTRIVDPELPSTRVRHVLVQSATEREQEVIVRRGDSRIFAPGDSVYVCQPFGPPHLEKPVRGFIYCQISRFHLATPMAIVGALLCMTSFVALIILAIRNRKTESGPRD